MSISTILFIIVAILIVYMLYKKYQGGSDVAPSPNRSSTGGPRIEIDETLLELNPDSSNKEEGYMTEQYTEFLTGDEQTTLSGNVVLQLKWANREGFGTVKELRFYRYLDSADELPENKTYANRKKDKTALKPTKLVALYDKDGTETAVDANKIKYRDNYAYILKSDDSNMFTSFKSGYKIKFGNKNKDDGGAYSVVGRTHMRIEYVLDDANNNATGHLVPETFEGTDVTVEDLDLTLSMTETETRNIKPVYRGTQVTSDVVKETFYVIPGPFETTSDYKIKIGGRRDLGNIATSELFPEAGILRNYWGWGDKPFGKASQYSNDDVGKAQTDIFAFTNHWEHKKNSNGMSSATFIDGFINDKNFKKRVHPQRSVMFRAAGDTEEFHIVISKTKFKPPAYTDASINRVSVENWNHYNPHDHKNSHLLNHQNHREFSSDDERNGQSYRTKFTESDGIGVRAFHTSSSRPNSKYKDAEEHWAPLNDEGGEFFVKIDDTNEKVGWKLVNESANASKFRLFKKDSKTWEKKEQPENIDVPVHIYNIQLVEDGVIDEERRFLVTTNHAKKEDATRNDNRIFAKKIDANLSESEYISIDWAFINTTKVRNGYKKRDNDLEMIVNETKDDANKSLNDFDYDF